MLSVVNISKRFGSHVALENVSFDLAPGRVLGLLGANGAGKSTTMRIASGILGADSGSISWAGGGDPRAQVAFADQEIALYPYLSARENLLFFAGLVDPTGVGSRRRVERVCALFALEGLLAHRAATLSGGQRRQVHIACAALAERPVLILDEPTAGLDIVARDRLLSSLRGLAAEGVAVCCSTHYTAEVAQVADRTVVLDGGRVIVDTGVSDLEAGAPTLLEITFRGGAVTRRVLTDALGAGAVIADLERGGADISDYRIIRPSLETAVALLLGQAGRDRGDLQ